MVDEYCENMINMIISSYYKISKQNLHHLFVLSLEKTKALFKWYTNSYSFIDNSLIKDLMHISNNYMYEFVLVIRKKNNQKKNARF